MNIKIKHLFRTSIFSALLASIVLIGVVACDDDGSNDANDTSAKKIGVMLPLTGESPVDVAALKTIMNIAVSDVNELLSAEDAGFQISADLKDSENSPSGVVAAINGFEARGIKCMVAAGTSQNIYDAEFALSSYSGIMLHTTSTTNVLAKQDNLFRFISNDSLTAEAIAVRVWADGKKKIVLMFRDDVWGTNFSAHVQSQFEALGGQIAASISYNARLVPDCIPNAVTTTEAKVDSVLIATPASELALVVMSFIETINILTEADGLNMLSIAWYGTDGNLLNDDILSGSQTVADNAVKVGLYSPAIQIPTSTAYTQLKTELEGKLGYAPRANNYILYDAIFAAALAMREADTLSAAAIETALGTVLISHDFITGDISLDENGDRLNGVYDFYHVAKENNDYLWEISE